MQRQSHGMRRYLAGFLLIWTLVFACVAGAIAQDHARVDAIDLHSGLQLDALIRQLATKRVVFIGEIHDRYDHHLNQLAIIKGLHDLDSNMAIGVEYFQQPFQSHVDDYIAGRISEHEFLRTTEYYSRWRFDYRLYAPIFRYAREQHIPVIALNVPDSLVSTVARVGLAGVPEKERTYLPHSIEPADPAYRSRLYEAFEEHPGLKPDAFKHFVEAQLVWDEGMAERAAAYLNSNQGRHLVILAGAGHLEYGSGIPSRLERRTHASYAIVLSSGEEVEPHIADYLVLSEKQELWPAGVLNVRLINKGGECRIASLTAGGAGATAGLRKGDVLVSINGALIKSHADANLALWDKKPGDLMRIEVRRERFLRAAAHLNFEIKLAASAKPM
jgi:uncharacterized iron-regulated protein